MKVAAAVARESFEWSIAEQQISIGHYTQSENIVVQNFIILAEDKDLEKIYEILSNIEVVIVVDETRISLDKLVVDEFKAQLAKNNVEFISLI